MLRSETSDANPDCEVELRRSESFAAIAGALSKCKLELVSRSLALCGDGRGFCTRARIVKNSFPTTSMQRSRASMFTTGPTIFAKGSNTPGICSSNVPTTILEKVYNPVRYTSFERPLCAVNYLFRNVSSPCHNVPLLYYCVEFLSSGGVEYIERQHRCVNAKLFDDVTHFKQEGTNLPDSP